MSSIRKKADFNIDDAFSESLEDKIRIYTTTSETAPLTETIIEEPPGFETSTLSLTPGSPDVFRDIGGQTKPPILKNKKSLQNPTLKALKAKEDNIDSTSQDSISLIQNNPGYYEGPAASKFWWKHPKIKQNWKMVVAALILVFLGTGLIITGIVAYSHPNLAGIQGFVFFIAGFICLAPGGYHLVYVYLAVKGKRGFDFHHLPLFN
eukprot:GFUD01002164.1.p1 GENE.GFUD01002164.1~~GFUD01002164.1.p1  ORF type:complete len:207 (-),score=48.04 GFUD01002164.1:282-902(-)